MRPVRVGFQFSSTTEAVPERRATHEFVLHNVSILEHDRSRARRPVVRGVHVRRCFNSRARPKPCPSPPLGLRAGHPKLFQFSSTTEAVPETTTINSVRSLSVSILEHDRSRARREVTRRIGTATVFQFSSTTEAVPEKARTRERDAHAFQFSSTTEAVPDRVGFLGYPIAFVSILEHDRSRARVNGFAGRLEGMEFQFSSTTEAVPDTRGRGTPRMAIGFNSRARPKPCPSAVLRDRDAIDRVSILEHDRSRARRAARLGSR